MAAYASETHEHIQERGGGGGGHVRTWACKFITSKVVEYEVKTVGKRQWRASLATLDVMARACASCPPREMSRRVCSNKTRERPPRPFTVYRSTRQETTLSGFLKSYCVEI